MAVCEGNLSYGCGILFWLQNWIPELGPLVEFATRELNGKDLTKTITELVVHEGGSNSDYLGSSLMRTLKLKDPHKN